MEIKKNLFRYTRGNKTCMKCSQNTRLFFRYKYINYFILDALTKTACKEVYSKKTVLNLRHQMRLILSGN